MSAHTGHYIMGPDHELIEVFVHDENGALNEAMLLKWGEHFGNINNRRCGWSKVGPFRVSTVFLSLDHNFSCEGPPILFETMVWNEECKRKRVFGVEVIEEVERYGTRHETYEQAMAYHLATVELIKATVLGVYAVSRYTREELAALP